MLNEERQRAILEMLSRDGRVHVRTDGRRTEIGGQCVTVIEGEVRV